MLLPAAGRVYALVRMRNKTLIGGLGTYTSLAEDEAAYSLIRSLLLLQHSR